MRKRDLLSLLLIATISLSSVQSSGAKSFEPTWESLKEAKPAEWWLDGKFGIFIHWGPYSVAGYKLGGRGYAEAITSDMYQRPEQYQEFFMEKFGKCPPEFGYKDWVDLYTAERWNPTEWAELFREAGAKYVIPTAEHHDGFANWDSELTPWNAMDMGPKRDLIGELATAVRKEGLNYGVSYHRERHPSRFAPKGFKVENEPLPLVAEEIKRNPQAALLYGPFNYSDEFIADYVARWQELQRRYSPDFMWLDDCPLFTHDSIGDPQVARYKSAMQRMIADYLNNAQREGKEVYFNNKGRMLNFPDGVGCMERDNLQMDRIGPPWQNPATMGVSYAYMELEEQGDKYKTPAELIRLLVDVVSKNGNLLLNIGPRADGTIPEGMQRRLLAMGSWLKVNGDAIYSTRPWRVYGESSGDIITEEGVKYEKHSMRIKEREYRYTTKDNRVYITAFQPDNIVTLHSFKPSDRVKRVEDLQGNSLKWDLSDDGLTITPKPNAEFNIATVYVVTLAK
ncbi:MAG: alpha-L-fucosidase [Rikenellaceae bacterium]